MPVVSVVMPAYNAEKTIRAAMDSVLSQTFGNLELIVVDDCSTDGTGAVIGELAKQDSRVVFLQNEKNSGASATRNRAIAQARGEWIAFLDSDDLWAAEKLEKQLALLEEHPDMLVCYTASSFINDAGEPYSYVLPAKQVTTYRDLLRANRMSCSSVLVKTAVVRQIPMPGDSMHEDYYVWLNILRSGTVAYGINEPLLIYRLCACSKSSNRLKSAKMLYNTYKAVGFSELKTWFLTFRYTFYSVSKRYKIKK